MKFDLIYDPKDDCRLVVAARFNRSSTLQGCGGTVVGELNLDSFVHGRTPVLAPQLVPDLGLCEKLQGGIAQLLRAHYDGAYPADADQRVAMLMAGLERVKLNLFLASSNKYSTVFVAAAPSEDVYLDKECVYVDGVAVQNGIETIRKRGYMDIPKMAVNSAYPTCYPVKNGGKPGLLMRSD